MSTSNHFPQKEANRPGTKGKPTARQTTRKKGDTAETLFGDFFSLHFGDYW